MRAFYENPDRINTELTLLTLKRKITKCMFLSFTKLFKLFEPDQTAPVGAVSSGSTMFASLLMLNRYFQMQLFCWRFKD